MLLTDLISLWIQAEKDYQVHPMHVNFRDKVLVPLLQPDANPKVLAMDFEHTPAVCPFGWKSFVGAGVLVGALVGAALTRGGK